MTFRDELAADLHGRVVIVGVGNPMRADDGSGSLVARRLEGTPGLTVIDAEEVPESHIGRIVAMKPDVVIMVDAVNMGATPGALALIEHKDITAFVPSTHRSPLGLVLDYVERETGARTRVIGIQPGTLTFGAPLTDEVAAAAELLAAMIREIAAEQHLGCASEVPA